MTEEQGKVVELFEQVSENSVDVETDDDTGEKFINIPKDMGFTISIAKEIMSQVWADDFLYSMNPNIKDNQLEVSLQSIRYPGLKKTFPVPAEWETTLTIRQACIYVAFEMYQRERERMKEEV